MKTKNKNSSNNRNLVDDEGIEVRFNANGNLITKEVYKNAIREGLVSKCDEKAFVEFKDRLKEKYNEVYTYYSHFTNEQINLNFYILFLWHNCNNLESELIRKKHEYFSIEFMNNPGILNDYIFKIGEIENLNLKTQISEFFSQWNFNSQKIDGKMFDNIFVIVKTFLKQREIYLEKALQGQKILNELVMSERELVKNLSEDNEKKRFEYCKTLVYKNDNFYPILFNHAKHIIENNNIKNRSEFYSFISDIREINKKIIVKDRAVLEESTGKQYKRYEKAGFVPNLSDILSIRL